MNNKAIIVATALVLIAQACSTYLVLALHQHQDTEIFADHVQRFTFDGKTFRVYFGSTKWHAGARAEEVTVLRLVLPREVAASLHMQMGRVLMTTGPLEST